MRRFGFMHGRADTPHTPSRTCGLSLRWVLHGVQTNFGHFLMTTACLAEKGCRKIQRRAETTKNQMTPTGGAFGQRLRLTSVSSTTAEDVEAEQPSADG